MISKDSLNYRWIILSIIVTSQLVLSVAGYGWGPLSPFFKKLLSLSSTQIGTISSTFYFTAAVSAFPAGIAVDLFGVKRGFLLWLGLTGVPLLILSFIQNSYKFLLIMVAISGLGYGMGNPVTAKGLYKWFDIKLRGTVFGIKQAAVTGGAAIAGVFFVYLSQKIGSFNAIRTISLMIIFMVVLVFFLYTDPDKKEDISDDATVKDMRLTKSGLKELFMDRVLLIVFIIITILGLAQGTIATFFLLYINEKLGYSLLVSGSLLTVVMVSGAAGRILWGFLSDRLFCGNRKPALILISFLAVLTVTILAFWTVTWPKWLFIPLVIGIGMTTVGWNSIVLVLVTEVCDSSKTASAVGLASTFGWIGLAMGPVAFGSLTDYFGYFHAWISLAVFCSISFILCIFIPVLENESIVQ